jgi:apolipoprotein N-acyltransferase
MNTLFSLTWLAIGGALRFFDFGKRTIPMAVWLSPIFLLHFSRANDPLTGMLAIWSVIFLAALFAYRDVIPVPGIFYPLIVAFISVTGTLPYLADRLLYARLPGFAAVMVFPIAWVIMEFITARTSPYTTWGSIAYTQYGDHPLMQLASVTGLWGISFLIAWFGSTINWAWDKQFDWSIIQGGLLAYAVLWSLVMLVGGMRLVRAKSPRTVRVATIGWPEDILGRDTFTRLFASEPLSEKERIDFQNAFGNLQNYFLEESQREACAGAKIVVWPEADLLIFQKDEAAFMERATKLTRDAQIYLLMGMGTIIDGNPARLENKAVLMDPSGNPVYSYIKKNPVPGWEAQISVPSDGRIHTYDSEYGLLASAICYDMDFPQFIRQAGKAGTDIMLVPASDWEPIKHLHHAMAVFRAVENGTSLVRATRWGNSTAVDSFGRTLAIMDSFSSAQNMMVAEVPISGVRTIYSKLGDWFAWLCVVGLLGLVGFAIAGIF